MNVFFMEKYDDVFWEKIWYLCTLVEHKLLIKVRFDEGSNVQFEKIM